MYHSYQNTSSGPAKSRFPGQPLPAEAAIERAILRGRKMRSEAFWNLLGKAGRSLGKAIIAVRQYNQRRRASAALRQMDAHLLADIGLTPGEVERAVARGREPKPAEALMTCAASPTAANDAPKTREAA